MCEFERNLYCPRCRTIQSFLFGGAGNNGMCMECDYIASGEENIQTLHHLAVLYSQQSKKRTLWNFITEDIQF